MPRAGMAMLAVSMLACGSTVPAQAGADVPYVERGEASWYGDPFHGRATASGEIFDQNQLTAAHPELPLGIEVKVTNLESGRSVEVQINDRGPFVDGRVIDLSKAAAEELDMVEQGLAPVRIEAEAAELERAEKELAQTQAAVE